MFDPSDAPDFSHSTEADVPEIARTIRALRIVGKESRVNTQLTQSAILRSLKPAILIAVSLELEKPYGRLAEKLGGVDGAK